MSAILLGRNIEEKLLIEEKVPQNKDNDLGEQIIEGKNKTYVIAKTIGKGTFGKVKIAFNIDNKNEKYACKILLKSNIKDEDDSIRCKREMDILRRMHHVNVVRTYEIVSTDTTFYIFMDFCAKGELFNYIVQQKHLSEEKSAFFYYQLINGIEYIHKKGVCHRDLKPENLLLTEKMKLKIIDFGLSNYFSGNLLETPCGSPCYASPEMVIGNKYNGFCIDVWSSGIILFAMLCGYLPFEEADNDEYNEILFRNIVECNIEYPVQFVTPVARDLLSKILVKDPRKRITIEEIKQHNFYLLGELLYKQTFESFGPLKEYDLFYTEEKSNKNSFMNEFKKNERDEEEKKYIESIKMMEDIYKDKDNEKNKKNEKNENIIESPIKIDKSINNKENIQNHNNYIREILYSSDKKSKNSNLIDDNKEEIKIEDKNKDNIVDKKNKTNEEQNVIKKKEKDNIPKDIEQKIEDSNITKKLSQDKDKVKNEEKKITLKTEENYDKLPKNKVKQLSSSNYNDDKLLTTDTQKTYKSSIQKLFNLKIDKNNKEEKMFKEHSVYESYNNYLQLKKYNQMNYNPNYLNTEIYPKNKRIHSKMDYYNCKLIDKKSLLDNKITFNNIIKTLQNQEYFKSKTPLRYTIGNGVIVKKGSVLSNTIIKAKEKYNSHSPGFRKFAKINNDIHFKIKKNLKFPRQNNYPLTNHNNAKNSYFLLNDNILKYFDPKKFFIQNNNKNFKPNKKFVANDNNNNNNNASKKYSKSIKNNVNNNNLNIFNKKNGKTISSVKTNLEQELTKNAMNKLLNLRSFEYCLSSNGSKRKHPIIESNKNNKNNNINTNFPSDKYIKSKNARNIISKKSISKQMGGNIQLWSQNNDSCKPIINNKNFITNTEINTNKIISIGKNKFNLNPNKKLKLKTKNKRSNFHNLLTNNLNYIKNKDIQDKDNNIIINLNILKPNIILDRQKSSKKPINNKSGFNGNSISINYNNNLNNMKVERPRTESNLSSTVRNNFYVANRGKNKNYNNFDAFQIRKSGEIKIYKSIQDMHRVHGSLGNDRRRITKEIKY